MAHLRVTQLLLVLFSWTYTPTHTQIRALDNWNCVRKLHMHMEHTVHVLFLCTGRAYFSWPNTPCRMPHAACRMLHEPTAKSDVWIGNSIALRLRKSFKRTRELEENSKPYVKSSNCRASNSTTTIIVSMFDSFIEIVVECGQTIFGKLFA